MKIFAIVSLAIFLVMKAIVYTVLFTSKRGYETDYGRVLSIVLPVMSVVIYAGCFYMMSGVEIGFVINIILAWLVLLVSLIVVRYLRVAFCYITANNNYDSYKIASGVVKYANKISPDIIYDDNIGMGNHVKISFVRSKFSRAKMAVLISDLYVRNNAKRQIRRISLLSFMIHSAELIFDISFLVNISML